MALWKSRKTAPATAPAQPPARLLIQALEPRLMFDGAALHTAITALHPDAASTSAHAEAHTASHPAPERGTETAALERLAQHAQPVTTPEAGRQVIFIDTTVANYQSLLSQVPPGADVVLLDASHDGLAQIAQWAGSHHGYSAIHIVSHGERGDLLLGNTTLDATALAARQGELARIGQALAPGGDILLYGCDIGAGAQGAAFVSRLAGLTHADVAASTDATGAARLGGDWTLERHSGPIEAASLRFTYDGLLARPVSGLTDFIYRDGISTVVPNGAPYLTMSDVEGWDITMWLNSAGDGANELLSVQRDGGNTVETVDAISDGVKQIAYLSAQPNDSSLFTLNSVAVVMGGYDLGVNSGMVQLVGYLHGYAVSGAILSLPVTDINFGGTAVTFDVSGNSSFQGIDSFRVQAANGHDITGQVGFGNIVATNFHFPAPVLTTSGGNGVYSGGDGAAVAVDSGITLSDAFATTQASATVSITGNFHSGEDILAFSNTDSSTYGNIAASYSGGTGVLTLTSNGANATTAQWQAALRAVTYRDSSLAPNTSTRTISFVITDGASYTSGTVTRNVSVAADVAPTFANLNGDSVTYTAGGGAVHLDGGTAATVSDSDSPNFNGGSVAAHVSANGHSSEDVLGIDGSGTVSLSNGTSVGSTVSVGGVVVGAIASNGDGIGGHDLFVSLNGNATVARVTTLVNALTYDNSAGSPNTAMRTVQVAVDDGHGQSSSAAAITVAVLNAPILTTSGGSAAFTAGDNSAATPVVVDAGLTVTDPGSSTLASATVSISGNFQSGQDTLSFVNTNASLYGNITASYNSGIGVLTLSSGGATATLAQWQAALRAVTYTDTAVTPNTATRTISFLAIDGNANISAAGTRTVTVAAVDQTPLITSSGAGASFTGGDNTAGTPVTIDAGITLADLDNTTLASATVAITGNFHAGEDTLAFTNNATLYGNIIGSYNSGSGVLTLSSSGATATVAQWQAALRAVQYGNNVAMPDTATRTVSFTVNDGTKSSAAATGQVTLATVAQTPVLAASAGSTAFVAGDNGPATPVTVDGGWTLADGDSGTLASATLAITGNFHASEDVLAFSNSNATLYGNISASYDAATGVLSMSSSGATATVAQWQAALRAVTYNDSAATPNTATRFISATVSDGGRTSAGAGKLITVSTTDQSPIVVAGAGSAAYVAGDNAAGTPVLVASGLTLSDLDNTTLAGATVAITGNLHSGEDVLSFANDGSSMGNISAMYNSGSGTLTMTSSGATATLAQWQAALRAVSYRNSAVTPDTSSRGISITVNDGSKDSAAASRTVTVAATDQTPLLVGTAGSVAFTAGDGVPATPVALDTALTVHDADNSTLDSATVAITGNFRSGEDVLAFNNNSAASYGNIAASYDAGTGVLTLSSASATATVAQWQAALRATTYTNSADTPDLATRSVSVSVSDGSKSSTGFMRNITLALPPYTPVLAGSGGHASFLADGTATPVAVDGALQVSDRDSATLASATVAISGNFRTGQDVLTFTNSSATLYGNIAASYNTGTGMLTLTSSGATATVAQWQAALRAVSYTNSAGVPDMTTRTVSFAVSDGGLTSHVATRDVQLTLPTPQLTGLSAASDTGSSNSDGVTSNALPTVNGHALAGATVTVTVDGTAVGTTTADGSGAWSYTFASALADGNHSVSATIGSGGVNSPAATALSMVIDTVAPASPGNLQLTSGAAARPAVSGQAEAGSTVTVLVDGVAAGTTQADGNGAWHWTASTALPDGAHTVRAIATDRAGNASVTAPAVSFTVDTRVPPPPAPALWLAAGSDSGSSDSDGLTNVAQPTVAGTAQAGSTVTVMVDGAVAGTASADADGNWRYTLGTGLSDGPHSITAVAANAGGPGASSAAVGLTVDTTAPGAPAITDLGAHAAQPQFSGSAEANSIVTVVVDDVVAGTAKADASGHWTLSLSGTLADGAHSVRATASDAAGNTSAASAARGWTVDTAPPATPSGLTLAAGADTGTSASDGLTSVRQPQIQGNARAGTTVTISIDGVAMGSTVADAQGAWRWQPGAALADGAHRVTAVATNAEGVTSAASAPLMVTIDGSAPRLVSIDALDATTSTGGNLRYAVQFSEPVALAADAFTLALGDGVQARITSVTADGDGRYVVQISASGQGSVALALRQGGAGDLAGNLLAQGGNGGAYQIKPAPAPVPTPIPLPTPTPAPAPAPAPGNQQAAIFVSPTGGDSTVITGQPGGVSALPAVVVTTVREVQQSTFTPATPGGDHFGTLSGDFGNTSGRSGLPADVQDMGVRALAAGHSFDIGLTDTNGLSATTTSVRLGDGEPLPTWLRFDPATGHLTGTAPPGWKQNLTLEVRSVDQTGRAHVTHLQLRVTGTPPAKASGAAATPPARPAPAKQAFNEQMRHYGKHAFEQQLANWLASEDA